MTVNIFWSLIATTLAFSAPLLLAALGELIGEWSGVLNIGLEGMMLCGAWAGAAASFAYHNAGWGILAAMGAGLGVAALFALLAITLKGDAIVVGTGLNLFALGLTGVAHRTLGARFGTYNSVTLPQWVFIILGAVLVPLLWWSFRKTRLGLQVRAVGEYPVAADTAGVNVPRVRWLCTLLNGALCGLAGAFLSMSQTNSFAENMTAGRGFIALAIVIFGRWNPFGALGAALLFGAAEGTQFFLQSKIGTTYYPLLLALPYILTLLTLAGFAGTSRAPAALAQPYER
ncbi:MAG: ABC transporter permease [Abitibacteriaceae bacterium]|nr:ABC transporter permease [Abditibacteriaceae bacterium]MBV9865086.1 ABC transporter permease [Abditibacteriaceae bacterium]